MKLVRNTTIDGTCKYDIINRSKIKDLGEEEKNKVLEAIDVLKQSGIYTECLLNNKEEFFVIKLKDQFAKPALEAYAESVKQYAVSVGDADLSDYGADVSDLANRSGVNNVYCKIPD